MVGGEGDDQVWGSGHGAIAIVVCYGGGEGVFFFWRYSTVY